MHHEEEIQQNIAWVKLPKTFDLQSMICIDFTLFGKKRGVRLSTLNSSDIYPSPVTAMV